MINEDDTTPKVVWRERALEAERYLMEVRRELEAAIARAERSERQRSIADTYRRTVEQQAANVVMPLPVSRADVEKAIRGEDLFERQIDAVWSLVSGDDPAVYVVRESDITDIEVGPDDSGYGWMVGSTWWGSGSTASGMRENAAIHVRLATECEALARHIEAAVDPVEKKAQELWESTREGGAPVAAWSDAHEDAQAQFRILARHVLGQEADQ